MSARAGIRLGEAIEAAMNPLINMRPLRARRLGLVLVLDREVVEDVFTPTMHAVHAATNQRCHLVGE